MKKLILVLVLQAVFSQFTIDTFSSPYEDTDFIDIIAGANLLLESVITLGKNY